MAVAVLAMLASSVAVGGSSTRTAVASTTLLSPTLPVAGTISGPFSNCLENENGVDASANSPAVGNPVDLISDCTEGAGYELWTLEPNEQIQVNFAPGDARDCLRVLSDNVSVGSFPCSSTSSETWVWTGVNGNELKNTGTNKCLTSQGLNQQLQVASCSGTGQTWNVDQSPTTQAATAAVSLLGMYNGGLGLFKDQFITPTHTCAIHANSSATGTSVLQDEFGGNCWWWSANAFSSLITFDEQASGTTWTHNANGTWTVSAQTPWAGDANLRADLLNTYDTICSIAAGPTSLPYGGACPVTNGNSDASPWSDKDGMGRVRYQTPSIYPNQFENNYFDDTANWALMWLNAYQLTGKLNYYYLAQSLWYYITDNGWDTGASNWQCVAKSTLDSAASHAGVAQFIHWNGTYTAGHPAKNIGVNSLYLWLSAWLYSLTGNPDYFDGVPDGSTTDGGLYQEALWLLNTSDLVQEISAGNPALDAPGTLYLFDGEINPDSTPACGVLTNQPKETQHMGTAVEALRAMYPAIEKASEQSAPNIPADYTAHFASTKTQSEESYLQMADNLAETVMGAGPGSQVASSQTQGAQFIDGTSPGGGVLSETCASTTGAWPDGCEVNKPSSGPTKNAWLPGKGIFLRSVSCLNVDLPKLGMSDSGLAPFISNNATSVWQNDQNFMGPDDTTDVNKFGFLWDDNLLPAMTSTNWPDGSDQPGQGYATQASALEALSAYLDQSTAMCDGQT